jgi:hypothetical protein
MTAPALVVIGGIILVNHDDLWHAARGRAEAAARAEMVLYEMEQTVEPIEPTRVG